MEENIRYLKRLGLTEYQSKAMVVLLNKRKTTAKDISDLSGIPLTKVYQVLKDLEEKKLLYSEEDKPRMYRTLPAYKIMNRLLAEKRRHLDRLLKERGRRLESIRKLDFEEYIRIYEEKIHPCVGVEQYEF
ncbi:TPA: hypothetical protein H1011_00075 [archaeon]|uniref:Transcription regulator TrmB N-terminal domain-containing protein n=1 Tax=Candidatus Undinarchaeum marinum TaxID=2756141 RepID=A0A832XKZ0_9ARCH|nr:hypothetical protein [Candidatus Undinarchaeum marinum]